MDDDRRWYDSDPTLAEAIELLRLSTTDVQGQASDFILEMQDQVAQEVIEMVYDAVHKYATKGTRWYDGDTVVLKAVELLKSAPPEIQRQAAEKLITALANNQIDENKDLNDCDKD